jgi:hypothetical protein
MVEKHYSDDWAKSKSRDLVREMIQKTLLTFRKPKDLKILFFPGIDAIEVFEVYDELGIPRENLIGVERDKNVAQTLEGENLGIQIINQSLEDYVEEQSSFNFDVVSLDYIGPVNKTQITTLGNICKIQRRNHWVFHCANLIRREKDLGMYAAGWSAFGEAKESGSEEMKEMCEKLLNFRGNGYGELAPLRDKGYTGLLTLVINGYESLSTDKILKFITGASYSKVNDSIMKEINEKFDLEISHIKETTLQGPMAYFTQRTLEMLEGKGKSLGISSKGLKVLILALGDLASTKRFFWSRATREYSYISESGSPMIGEIRFLSYPEKVMSVAQDVGNNIGYPKELRLTDKRNFNKLMRKYVNCRNNYILKSSFGVSEDSERIFLGNSSKPVLTKQRAIEEFRAGVSVDDIVTKYRAIGNKPLAQWKAHVTMGTYDQIKNGGGDLEKITKNEAIDLITSGIPLEEVHNAYPTSFSVGQLRAFKAHTTMGTYKK